MRLGVAVVAAALALALAVYIAAAAGSDSKAQPAQSASDSQQYTQDAAVEGLTIGGNDPFWYMEGRLPKKMNIEVDDVVRRILERPVRAPGPARGEFQIDERLREWFHNDTAGREVYERCYGGMFVDAARIYIVVTDRACGEKIRRAVEDLASRYGTELVILKGKYTYRQLSQWADALFHRVKEGLEDRLKQICGKYVVTMLMVDQATNQIVVGINPDCTSQAVVKEIAKALDELGIPKDAVVLEKFPGFVLLSD
ncbi:TM1812 family CRISPR-associated protein [Pyrobaculum neutrophilum]|nr:TM1812 family CRISPR-associated protein [Pyrobaculum neutrophilum]